MTFGEAPNFDVADSLDGAYLGPFMAQAWKICDNEDKTHKKVTLWIQQQFTKLHKLMSSPENN